MARMFICEETIDPRMLARFDNENYLVNRVWDGDKMNVVSGPTISPFESPSIFGSAHFEQKFAEIIPLGSFSIQVHIIHQGSKTCLFTSCDTEWSQDTEREFGMWTLNNFHDGSPEQLAKKLVSIMAMYHVMGE